MSKFFFLILFGISTSLFSQSGIQHEFGNPSQQEIEMVVYDKDPDADAVYLFERGDVSFEVIDNGIWIVKEYYAKIKVFNSLKFDGSLKVPFRKGERIESLEAITHNGEIIDKVSKDNIFSLHHSGLWHIKTLAFPNLKDGSIIEYRYKHLSPYHFSFEDWEFQSEYPKVYSEFHAKINANYIYRKTLIGDLKLSVENSRWEKNCLFIRGYTTSADCEVIHLGMKDIPAFIEEDFMLSKKNYISRISFDLIEYTSLSGKKTVYSKTWKEFDKNFENENVLFKELNHKRFFRNKVPTEIREIKDPLEQAKKVFGFFQDHYTWDNYLFRIDNEIELKKAFNNQTGSVDEINLSLLNSLLSLGHKAHIMLIATRNKGLPGNIHPSFYDYNYLIVRLEIDNKVYLLDASDKFSPFGFIPFRALNHHGRVFNYNGISFWQSTQVFQASTHQMTVIAKMEPNGKLKAKINERQTNHIARNKRAALSNKNLTAYKKEKEKLFDNNPISNLEIYNQHDNETPLVERFELEVDNPELNNKILINPFVYSFFDSNPLTLKQRSYPLNFAYPRTYIYQISIEIPENYEVLELPKNNSFLLNDNNLEIRFSIEENENKIDLMFIMKIDGVEYPAEVYARIKDLFSQSLNIQKNSLIILQKK